MNRVRCHCMTVGTKLKSLFQALFAPHYPRNYVGRHRVRYAIPLPVSLASSRRG